MNSQLDIRIDDVHDIDALRSEWECLLSRAHASFFLSWHWIGSWLTLVPKNVLLKQVIVRQNDKVVALCVFSESKIKRHGVFSSTVMALHECSLSNLNMVIEYNGFLIDKQADAISIQQSIIRFLISDVPGWDELKLSGVMADSVLLDKRFLQGVNLTPQVIGESEARRVNLDKVRDVQEAYLSTLKKKTRYKIRQYYNEYQHMGALKIDQAESMDDALRYFDGLKTCHQSYWNKKGQAGSFANKNWESFHHCVIKSAFSDGCVQLLRISAGGTIVGYLYNLVWEDHVYMIQSGFNYKDSYKDKDKDNDNETDKANHRHAYHPGYVCLSLAIEYNIKVGHRIFDFLAGENQYKKSFSNESVTLQWVMLQRKKMKFLIEDLSRMGKRKMLGQSSDVSF